MKTHSPSTIPILFDVVVSDPEILHGKPVFAGTEVPVQTLLDYRRSKSPLYEFLLDFPEVDPAQAREFLNWFEAQERVRGPARVRSLLRPPPHKHHPAPGPKKEHGSI